MPAAAPTRSTTRRLVALTLVALLVAGLIAVRLARGSALAVPEGATAGEVSLESCEIQTDGGPQPAECGTLVVAEDPADAGSPLLALPVIRVRARTDTPQEPVFFLTGGPGESNVEFASELADRYIADRDFVAVGYRGADGSVRLDCPEVSAVLARSPDVLSEVTSRDHADAHGACASRFATEGIDVTRYGLVQQVDDMEVARVALGYDRINLLSESAGTRTAFIYGLRHPESIHRSFMVGVNPPGAFLWDADLTDEQIGRFAARCAADASCATRTDDLAETIRRTAADVPDRWLFLPIKDANVRTLSLFGMFETAPTGPASAPMMIDTWLSASEGDSSGLWLVSVLADLLLPDLFIAGQYVSAASIDAAPARASFAEGVGDLSNLGRAPTAFAWAAGRWIDVWPTAAEAEAYQQVRSSPVETLVVNGELDVSTPPQLAQRDLLPHLPNGQEVVLDGFGHTESFFNEQPEAGTHLVTTFFDSGRVDTSRYQPQSLDFTPPTSFGGIARIVLAALVGLATVTVLSLAALARRVRTRGRIGPTAAALWRSIGLVVLGLGGWSIGALVVLTVLPGARIAGEPVIVVAVAVPIVLGSSLAWVRRDRSGPEVRAGGVAVALGTLTGAWLGFHVAVGLMALPTAIAGAVAGSNLALMMMDLRPRRSAERPPTTTRRDTPATLSSLTLLVRLR